ncbi:MAG: hypothetical protein ACO32I_07380 [Candidatus Limnocylindrus sp.]
MRATIATLADEEMSLLNENQRLIEAVVAAEAELRVRDARIATLNERLENLERSASALTDELSRAQEEIATLTRERDRLRAIIEEKDFELRQARDALSIEREARIALEARLQAMEALRGRSAETTSQDLNLCLQETERLRARVDRVQTNFDKYFRTSTETMQRLLKRNEACAAQ